MSVTDAAPTFDAAWRNVARADDKLRAIQNQALRLSQFVLSGEMTKSDVVDALRAIATTHNLCSTRERREDAEHVIGMGLKGVATLLPAPETKMQLSALSAKRERTPQTSGRALIIHRASDIVPEKVEWIWQGRIARGKHTTIAGDPGTGKSQVLIAMAAAVTTGGSWPCAEGQAPLGSVILMCAEDGLADTIVPRLIAAGADLNRTYIVGASRAEDGKGSRTFNLQTDLDLLEQKINDFGDVLLVGIDPVSSYMGGGVDSHKNAEVRRVLSPIGELAERAGVAVVSVTHFSKSGAGSSTKALYRIHRLHSLYRCTKGRVRSDGGSGG